jgi:methylase of polypeptide subunit release factors
MATAHRVRPILAATASAACVGLIVCLALRVARFNHITATVRWLASGHTRLACRRHRQAKRRTLDDGGLPAAHHCLPTNSGEPEHDVTDRVAAVAAEVDYDAWTTTEDGALVPQITTDTTIHAMLRLLDIQPGMQVMEIGTGSGYSGALLSRIVSSDGHVVSIDIDTGLINRARTLHNQARHTNIELHASDGFWGWANEEPFDRIVGWVTPHVLPAAWGRTSQAGSGDSDSRQDR